jgi:hypothetical protein
MAKRLIHTSNIVDYHLDTHEGVEMISRFNLFYRLMADELSEDKAQILAEPVKDLDHNRVNWYTNLPGSVVPFDQLAPDDRRFATDVVTERKADLLALSQRFLTSKSRNRKLAGELLANILGRAGSREIFLVGDRTVVAGWGLTSIKEAPVEDSQEISNVLRETKGTPEPPAPKPPEPMKSVPPPPPPPLPPLPPRAAKAPLARRSFFWPLSLLLFGLLLLAAWWLFGWTIPFLALDPDPPMAALPPVGPSLVIPEGAAERGDLSFMEGCWVSSSEDVHNDATKLPITIKYCFEKNGRAKVSLDEQNGAGSYTQTCSSEAQAAFDGGGLVIAEDFGQVCPDGRSYRKSVITCKEKSASDKSVVCVIVQENFEQVMEVDFHRLG